MDGLEDGRKKDGVVADISILQRVVVILII